MSPGCWRLPWAGRDDCPSPQFGGQNGDALDDRWLTQQCGCVRHERGGDRTGEVSVSTGFVRKRIEDSECPWAELHGEPHGGGRFGVGQGQRARQELVT